jgi:hypothetical protein
MVKKSSTVLKPAIACKVFSYSRYPFDFEIGGRNQNTQLCLNVCVGGGVAFLEPVRDAFDALAAMVFVKVVSLRLFSAVGVLAPPRTLPKSNALPGDFGVFEDPKDANAPEPSPNALDAPVVGEGTTFVGGDIALKGLDLPCDDVSPPYRFESV